MPSSVPVKVDAVPEVSWTPLNFGKNVSGSPTAFICRPSSQRVAVEVNVNVQEAWVSPNWRKSNSPHTPCQAALDEIVKFSVMEWPAEVATVKDPVAPEVARIWNAQNQRVAAAMAIGKPAKASVAPDAEMTTLRLAPP